MKNILHTDLSLKYLAQNEANATQKPMIIFLHGYGSNEEDLFELKEELLLGVTYLSVRAPMTIYEGSYQWYDLGKAQNNSPEVIDQMSAHAQLLENFIGEATKKYHTSRDKVILIGFSQGAIMSYELSLRNPDSVKGVIALSGRISPSLLPLITPMLDLKNLSIFIGHGTKDDRIHIRDAIKAHEVLSETSITPEYHAYSGMGHSINYEELKDMKSWLIKTLHLE